MVRQIYFFCWERDYNYGGDAFSEAETDGFTKIENIIDAEPSEEGVMTWSVLIQYGNGTEQCIKGPKNTFPIKRKNSIGISSDVLMRMKMVSSYV